MESYHEIPEEKIEEAAMSVYGDNAFRQLLITANMFRRANTEPVFLVNDDQTCMIVTCRETLGKRLH